MPSTEVVRAVGARQGRAGGGPASKVEYVALGGHGDPGRPRGHAPADLIERVVGAARLVVSKHDPPRPGPPAQADSLIDRGGAERRPGGHPPPVPQPTGRAGPPP